MNWSQRQIQPFAHLQEWTCVSPKRVACQTSSETEDSSKSNLRWEYEVTFSPLIYIQTAPFPGLIHPLICPPPFSITVPFYPPFFPILPIMPSHWPTLVGGSSVVHWHVGCCFSLPSGGLAVWAIGGCFTIAIKQSLLA